MSRGRALILTVIGLLLTGLGIFAALRDSGNRWTMITIAVFFGACALVGLLSLFPARLPDTAPDGSVTIRSSGFRAFCMMFASLAFALGGLWAPTMWAEGDQARAVVAALATPFGLLGAFVFARRAFGAKDRYRIDSHGVTSHSGKGWTLPWRAITEFQVFSVRGTRQLIAKLDPAFPFSGASTFARGVNKALGLGDVVLSTAESGIPFDDFAHLVTEYWTRYRDKA